MLLTAESPVSMERTSGVRSSHPARSRMMARKERGALVPPRSHRQRQLKTGRTPEDTSVKKERPDKKMEAVEQEAEVKVKTTVVDIDSVREDEIKEENLGLLEAAEQEDGEFVEHREILTAG